MIDVKTSCDLKLPAWVDGWLKEQDGTLLDDDDAMDLAVSLAGESIARDSGGPFAALVVDDDSGRLLSVGLNRVVTSGLSVAHAEVLALSLAQKALGHWNLGRVESLSLISTCEPCAMCYGALPWSGIRRLVYGACREDAVRAGFDEGDKPDDWQEALERRGISVVPEVRREHAVELFAKYRAAGGTIYNSR